MVIYSFWALDPGTYLVMVRVDPSATLELPDIKPWLYSKSQYWFS